MTLLMDEIKMSVNKAERRKWESECTCFKTYNLIYLLSIALTVGLGVRVVGGLMTAALVAIPASTVSNMSKSLTQYSYGGLGLGSLACILGTVGFRLTGLPAGPLIVIVGTFFFLVSLGLKR